MTPASSAVLLLATLPLLGLAGTFTLSIWLDRYAGGVRLCEPRDMPSWARATACAFAAWPRRAAALYCAGTCWRLHCALIVAQCAAPSIS